MTKLAGIDFGGTGPTLVLGPSLGTSATALWARAAALLTDRFRVVGWDLPGHGANHVVTDDVSIAGLAAGVLDLVDGPFAYAGDSVGGAVGLQLLLDAPDRVESAVLISTGARIGTAEAWHERAATVRASGTPTQVVGSAERWFAPGFLEREPEVGAKLLHSLQDASAEGYARVCEALADFDVRARLAEIAQPVLAIAGAHDVPTPPASLQEIADGVSDGRFVVLPDTAHLPPAEYPAAVARLIADHLGSNHG